MNHKTSKVFKTPVGAGFDAVNAQDGFRVDALTLDQYTKAGFTLFPCDGFTKRPLRRGFTTLSFDPTLEIRDQNHGVLLKERYLVIDVDKRSFQPEDDKPMSRLLEDCQVSKDILTQTFVVKTPSGGFHIYFSKPETIATKNSLRNYPGLEFKTNFIMAAGSYNEDRKVRYEIKHGAPASILKCPDMILAMLARGDDMIDLDLEGLNLDHPTNIARYTQFLATTDPAIEGKGGDNRTFMVAAVGKDYGLSWEKTLNLMLKHFNPRCRPEWNVEEMEAKVRNAYNHGYKPIGVDSIENQFDEITEKEDEPKSIPRAKFSETKKEFKPWDTHVSTGKLKNTSHNVVQLLSVRDAKDPNKPPMLKEKLQYNLFTNKIEWTVPPLWKKGGAIWDDDDGIHIKHTLSYNYSFDPPIKMIDEAAVVIASQKSYHPVREYILGLKWDIIPRIDTWLIDCCGAEDTPLTRFYSRKFLIAAVKRVFVPGCKFDHVLVLEGLQGLGKSMVCQILGSPWYTDAHVDVRQKDAIDIIQGNWIVELAEMYAVSKYESAAMKRFITAQVDRCRPAYGRNTKNFPRQSVFIGTVNPENEGYLKDHENRRYWPVAIKEVNIELLRQMKDQLFAEAYLAYMKGENIHVDDAHISKLAREDVAKRKIDEPWLYTIENWLDKHYFDYYDDDLHSCVITPVEIFNQCLGGRTTYFTGKEALRISGVLKTLGFNKQLVQKDGNRKTFYVKHLDKFLGL